MAHSKPSQAQLVLLVASAGIIISLLLYVFRPEAARKPAAIKPAEVKVVEVQPQNLFLSIHAQGKLQPAHQVQLSAEVSGKIIAMSPLSKTGRFFKQGDWLVKIDDRDYKLAIDKAEAQVAAAQQLLSKAEAEASQAKFDAERIENQQVSNYALRLPHLKEARAGLKGAQADLEIARLQLQRCLITAPFDGMVQKQLIQPQDFVATGRQLLQIYRSSPMEIYLPVTRQKMALLPDVVFTDDDWSLPVRIHARVHGKAGTWNAEAHRFEGSLDAKNQMYYLVAELPTSQQMLQQGILPGLFVDADISGKKIQNGFRLPRQTLRPGNKVWLVDDTNRLHIKPVEVIQKTPVDVLLKDGFSPGDKIVISALDIPVNGMQVSIIP